MREDPPLRVALHHEVQHAPRSAGRDARLPQDRRTIPPYGGITNSSAPMSTAVLNTRDSLSMSASPGPTRLVSPALIQGDITGKTGMCKPSVNRGSASMLPDCQLREVGGAPIPTAPCPPITSLNVTARLPCVSTKSWLNPVPNVLFHRMLFCNTT